MRKHPELGARILAGAMDNAGTQFDARMVAAFVETLAGDGLEDRSGGPAPGTPTSSTSSRVPSRFST